MREFFFLRHGETDWNRDNRIQGQISSVPLNATGLRQAEDAAGRFKTPPFDLIIASPFERAATTAHIIAATAQRPVIYDERLIEQGWGWAEGKTLQEAYDTDPTAFEKGSDRDNLSFTHFQPKGGESREALGDRASSAVLDLLQKHQEQTFLLVTHGAWLRALTLRLANLSMGFVNAKPYKASKSTQSWNITALD